MKPVVNTRSLVQRSCSLRYEIDGRLFSGTYEGVVKQVRNCYVTSDLVMQSNGDISLRDETAFLATVKHLRYMERVKSFLIDQAIKKIPKEIRIVGDFSVYINGEHLCEYGAVTLDELIRIRDE